MAERTRVALVTGAGSGIGEALARALVARGWSVWVADRDAMRAEAAAQAMGPSARALTLDVTDAEACLAAADKIEEHDGCVDMLVNNAGVGVAGLLSELSLEDWRRVIDVNLWGVVHCLQAFYPRMIRQKHGHILNIASGAGLAPRPGMAAYAATKHAVVGLSTSLRAEARLHDVSVSVACPGYVQTRVFDATRFVGVSKEAITARIPIAPMSADECARRILRGVDRGQPIIPISSYVWLDWILYRWFPRISVWASSLRAKQFAGSRDGSI